LKCFTVEIKTKEPQELSNPVDAKLKTLKALTRSQDERMSKGLSAYVAPFGHQIFLVLAQQNIPYNF
jgi:hypothetical protein